MQGIPPHDVQSFRRNRGVNMPQDKGLELLVVLGETVQLLKLAPSTCQQHGDGFTEPFANAAVIAMRKLLIRIVYRRPCRQFADEAIRNAFLRL
jgi:hypothetical protein